MATGPANAYEQGMRDIQLQLINWIDDNFVGLLLDDAYVPNLTTDRFIDDVIAHEHPGTGNYARVPLTALTSQLVGGQHEFGSAPIDFGADTTIAARFLVIAKNTGNDATSNLMFVSDLSGGGNLESTNGQFQISPTGGVWHFIDINEVAV